MLKIPNFAQPLEVADKLKWRIKTHSHSMQKLIQSAFTICFTLQHFYKYSRVKNDTF